MRADDEWYVYMVECKDGDLYVGTAQDVQKRLALHNKGRACRYTKFRWPVKLRYQECAGNYSAVRRREKELKGHTRNKKTDLINTVLCKNV